MGGGTHYAKCEKVTPMTVLGDCTAGVLTATTISSFVCIIDKSIMQYVKGSATLQGALKEGFTKLFFHPIKFHLDKSFGYAVPWRLVMMVYGGTYVTKHLIQSYCEANKIDPTMPVFSGSSVANCSLTILKDAMLVKMTATVSTAGPVPMASMLLFFLRDALTIFASFTIPPLIAAYLCAGDSSKDSKSVERKAQFISPLLIQLFSTPIHLTGIDYHESKTWPKPGSAKFWELAAKYPGSVASRMCRILPAFSIGGNVAKESRDYFLQSAQKKSEPSK